MGNDTQWSHAGAKVRKERNALGWTLERLSREADVSLSVVQLIERGGGGQRSLRSKRKVSVALGWTPESLEELGRAGREPERATSAANTAAQVIGELAARLPDYQQRLVEEHLRYLVELNRRLPAPVQ